MPGQQGDRGKTILTEAGESEWQKSQSEIRPAKPLLHQTVEVNRLFHFSAANMIPQASTLVRLVA